MAPEEDWALDEENEDRYADERDSSVDVEDDNLVRFFNKKLNDTESSGSVGFPSIQDKDFLDENGNVSAALKASKSIAIPTTGSNKKIGKLMQTSPTLFGFRSASEGGTSVYKGKLERYVSSSMMTGSAIDDKHPLYYGSPAFAPFMESLKSVLTISSSVTIGGLK